MFRKYARTNVSEYITRIRIGDACARLASTEQPIAHIANAVGYGTLMNFNRQFKLLTSMTKREYHAHFRRAWRNRWVGHASKWRNQWSLGCTFYRVRRMNIIERPRCANARPVIETFVRCSRPPESGVGPSTEGTRTTQWGPYHGRLHALHDVQRCLQLVVVPLAKFLRRQRHVNVG